MSDVREKSALSRFNESVSVSINERAKTAASLRVRNDRNSWRCSVCKISDFAWL